MHDRHQEVLHLPLLSHWSAGAGVWLLYTRRSHISTPGAGSRADGEAGDGGAQEDARGQDLEPDQEHGRVEGGELDRAGGGGDEEV